MAVRGRFTVFTFLLYSGGFVLVGKQPLRPQLSIRNWLLGHVIRAREDRGPHGGRKREFFTQMRLRNGRLCRLFCFFFLFFFLLKTAHSISAFFLSFSVLPSPSPLPLPPYLQTLSYYLKARSWKYFLALRNLKFCEKCQVWCKCICNTMQVAF